MAKPPEDPHVTDLARYRKQREVEARKKPPKPPGSGLLGSNPYAPWILAALVAVLIASVVLPMVL